MSDTIVGTQKGRKVTEAILASGTHAAGIDVRTPSKYSTVLVPVPELSSIHSLPATYSARNLGRRALRALPQTSCLLVRQRPVSALPA